MHGDRATAAVGARAKKATDHDGDCRNVLPTDDEEGRRGSTVTNPGVPCFLQDREFCCIIQQPRIYSTAGRRSSDRVAARTEPD